jgi:hypothetical protein
MLKSVASLALLAAALFASTPAHAGRTRHHSTNARHVPGRHTKDAAGTSTQHAQHSGTTKPKTSSQASSAIHPPEPAESPKVAAVAVPLDVTKASEPKRDSREKPSVVATKPERTIDGRPNESKAGGKVAEASKVRERKANDSKSSDQNAETPQHADKRAAKPAEGKETRTRDKDAKPASKPEALLSPDATKESEVMLGPREGSERAKLSGKAPCLRDGVMFSRGEEKESFSLTTCDGGVAPLAVEKLSILVRPESAPRPDKSTVELAKVKGRNLAPGVRKVDEGLVERLQAIVDHFSRAGAPSKVSVISGYRPASAGSYHSTAQALDFRIEGVANEPVVEMCKTIPDTGCGYYPNSSFVHLDVRQAGTGHVSWIDASGPGESPRYVSSWPPPPDPDVKIARQDNVMEKLDRELPPLPVDEHPSEIMHGPAAIITSPLDAKP